MQKNFVFFRSITSPIPVLVAFGVLSVVVYVIASGLSQEYAYFQLLVYQEGLRDDSTSESFLWLFASLFSMAFGAFVCNLLYRPKNVVLAADKDRLVRNLILAFLFTGAIAFLWVGVAIIKFGGVANLASAAASDNSMARAAIHATSFAGSRLISSGFIGLAVLSVFILSQESPLARSQKRLVVAIFLFSLLYLALIPILVSGRINFFVAILASFVVYSYSVKRLLPFKYMVGGLFLLSFVWIAKEYFNLGHIAGDVSPIQQGVQGMVFYFYNDILNALNTIVGFEDGLTYGWYSARFIFYFTFTDQAFLELISASKEKIGQYVTAGEIPLLAAAVVDFGVLGLIYLAMLGFLFQYIHRKSINDYKSVLQYGLVFAGLVLSIHNSYIMQQEIVYNFMLLSLLAKNAVVNVKHNWGGSFAER